MPLQGNQPQAFSRFIQNRCRERAVLFVRGGAFHAFDARIAVAQVLLELRRELAQVMEQSEIVCDAARAIPERGRELARFLRDAERVVHQRMPFGIVLSRRVRDIERGIRGGWEEIVGVVQKDAFSVCIYLGIVLQPRQQNRKKARTFYYESYAPDLSTPLGTVPLG